jgi:hypothetical protein
VLHHTAPWLRPATGRGRSPSAHETQINGETELHLALLRREANSFTVKKSSGKYCITKDFLHSQLYFDIAEKRTADIYKKNINI